jgi:hypothetical protein
MQNVENNYYSPAGLKHAADGGFIDGSSRKIWQIAAICCAVIFSRRLAVSCNPRLVAIFVARLRDIPLSSVVKNFINVIPGGLDFRRLERVMLFMPLGCGNMALATGGICWDRLTKDALNDFLSSRGQLNFSFRSAYGVITASC